MRSSLAASPSACGHNASRNALAMIDWLCTAFGFTRHAVYADGDIVHHAQLTFGNGMLMSDRTKLVAAFDHRHIFLDPSPDPTVSFDERKRLFALPRSSWADYDTKLISHGGGVWSRDAKSIPLSPELAAVLGVAPGARPPHQGTAVGIPAPRHGPGTPAAPVPYTHLTPPHSDLGEISGVAGSFKKKKETRHKGDSEAM